MELKEYGTKITMKQEKDIRMYELVIDGEFIMSSNNFDDILNYIKENDDEDNIQNNEKVELW